MQYKYALVTDNIELFYNQKLRGRKKYIIKINNKISIRVRMFLQKNRNKIHTMNF